MKNFVDDVTPDKVSVVYEEITSKTCDVLSASAVLYVLCLLANVHILSQ